MDQASDSLLGLYFDNCLPGAQVHGFNLGRTSRVFVHLALSVLVVTGYFFAAYANEVHGYNITVTLNHTEYGFLICAFLNGFVFYPAYLWWLRRRKSKASAPPPPLPPDFKT